MLKILLTILGCYIIIILTFSFTDVFGEQMLKSRNRRKMLKEQYKTFQLQNTLARIGVSAAFANVVSQIKIPIKNMPNEYLELLQDKNLIDYFFSHSDDEIKKEWSRLFGNNALDYIDLQYIRNTIKNRS